MYIYFLYIYIFIYIHIHISLFVCTVGCMQIYACVYIHINIYMNIYAYTYLRMYMIIVRRYTCMYTYIYNKHIFIHPSFRFVPHKIRAVINENVKKIICTRTLYIYMYTPALSFIQISQAKGHVHIFYDTF